MGNRTRDSARICRCDPPSLYLHVGQLRRMTTRSLVVLAVVDPAVPLRIPIAHVKALIRFPHDGPCREDAARASNLHRRPLAGPTCLSRVTSLIFTRAERDGSSTPSFRARPISKKKPLRARECGPTEIGMQTYKLRGPFRTSYQPNPARGRTLRAGRKLDGESS